MNIHCLILIAFTRWPMVNRKQPRHERYCSITSIFVNGIMMYDHDTAIKDAKRGNTYIFHTHTWEQPILVASSLQCKLSQWRYDGDSTQCWTLSASISSAPPAPAQSPSDSRWHKYLFGPCYRQTGGQLLIIELHTRYHISLFFSTTFLL